MTVVEAIRLDLAVDSNIERFGVVTFKNFVENLRPDKSTAEEATEGSIVGKGGGGFKVKNVGAVKKKRKMED